MQRMYQKVLDLVTAIENNNVFSSIRKGFILLIPILLTGAVALMLRNFPAEAVQEFYAGPGAGFYDILLYIYNVTFGFMSAYLVLSISYYYSFTFNVKDFSLQVMSMIVSFGCFLATFGPSLEISHLGHLGVFTALICAILGPKLFFTFCNMIYKRSHAYAVGADVNFRTSIISIVPMILCIAIFLGFNLLLTALFGVANLNELIAESFTALFQNMVSGLASGVLFLFMLNLLWFFGIHAGNALDQVASDVFVEANVDPNSIVSKTMMDNFALIGGCGMTICLLLALLIAARSKSNRRLAWSSAPVLIFNINEILVYGLPIVLNPVMLIPFIVVPIVSLLITYGATMLGWIPVITESVNWTTPPLLSGYLSTGTSGGVIVQIIVIAVGTLIYIPFVRLSEKIQQAREILLVGKMAEKFRKSQEDGIQMKFMAKHDDISVTAKSMLLQLRSDVDNKKIELYYQPQLDVNDRIAGAEALLRWRYSGQMIYPPMVIALAQEDKYYTELTARIIEKVCDDIVTLKKETREDIKISANITVEQLNDSKFVNSVIEMVERRGLKGNLGLEVTEETSIMYYDKIAQHIDMLNACGIPIAIDDFSMGQTSLKYLQTNDFDSVKLDGALVKEVAKNVRSRDIIKSIISLGNTLGFVTIAEYVETREIRDLLYELGCKYFQGYLYSPAIPPEEFIAFYKKHMAALEAPKPEG
ncbi:EAL domain-containing protein [Christensenellaceae bacterium OttesenSCG-928-K19]|nr:EAL domain-containing protein [Christensenellaceae bacterium OttesenSCG-928-K19]